VSLHPTFKMDTVSYVNWAFIEFGVRSVVSLSESSGIASKEKALHQTLHSNKNRTDCPTTVGQMAQHFLRNKSRNNWGTEHPKTTWKTVEQGPLNRWKGKDGR